MLEQSVAGRYMSDSSVAGLNHLTEYLGSLAVQADGSGRVLNVNAFKVHVHRKLSAQVRPSGVLLSSSLSCFNGLQKAADDEHSNQQGSEPKWEIVCNLC